MKYDGNFYEVLNALELTMARRYGADGEHPLAYHNDTHAREVSLAAEQMGVYMGLPLRQIGLGAIAGMGHDIVQLQGSGVNEERSASQTIEVMGLVGGFSDSETRLVGECIVGTTVSFTSDGIMTQAANSNQLMESIIADADLAALGKPSAIYFPILQTLFNEWNPGEVYGGELKTEFLKGTVQLLTHHQYYTDAARTLFPFQDRNRRLLSQTLTGLTA